MFLFVTYWCLKQQQHLASIAPFLHSHRSHIYTMNFYGKLLCFCVKFNMFSKFSHLCGYKTQFRTERSYMRPPRPGGRGDLKESERVERRGQTINNQTNNVMVWLEFYYVTSNALNKQEVIPPHEDTLENLVSHLMLAWNSSRDLSVIFFTQDEHCLDY